MMGKWTASPGRAAGTGLLRIISPFLAAIVLLVLLGAFAIDTLSAARAFVGGESLWAKGEKEAAHALTRFAHSRDEADYRDFLSNIAITLGDRAARIELDRASPDLALARDGFLQGGNHPDDIAGMIRLYRRFGHVGFMARAVQLWTGGDQHVGELIDVAQRIHRHLESQGGDDAALRKLVAQANVIDRQLTPMEQEFSYSLGDASRKTELILQACMVVLAGVLAGLAIALSRRLSRRAQQAEESIRRQAAQQGLIAAFGQAALENPTLDDLFVRAVAVVTDGLGAPCCRLLAAETDERSLRLRAASGWNAESTARLAQDIATGDEDRLAAGLRESVVVDDFAREPRFGGVALIQDNTLRSGAEVLVVGARGACGLLGVYAPRAGRFGPESLNFLRAVANVIAAAMDRKTADRQLMYLAQFDPLTALPNRSLVVDRLDHAIRQARRDCLSVGVLFVDLDRFKLVNDTLGHGAGDQLLQQVAKRLQGCVRAVDTVGRMGGDEFALALGGLADPEDARIVADKIVTAFAAPFDVAGQHLYLSASIGISLYPADGAEPDELLKNADAAMYRVKEAGRNAHQFYLSRMNEHAAQRLTLETQLRGALDRHEFVLHYQPKIDLDSGAVSGFEALLRWQHPERGLVAPADFIPILEETGLILPVGDWVIAEACRQLARWRAAGIALRPVAVNLSARQFTRTTLDVVIGRVLAATGIAPGLLELELTESMLMHDPEAAAATLARMKALGIRLAVDDFGTGYSSLAYLKRFPLDTLKIDRAFVRDVASDAEDATIAIAILNLARSLALNVVAEGVETEEQLDFLRAHGCPQAQGFHFSRPLTAEACTRALANEWRDAVAPPWARDPVA